MEYVFDDEIRNLTNRFVIGWQNADLMSLKNDILPDAVIDFDIFEKNINRDELLEKLSTRPRKTSYARFEMLNNVVVKGENKAKQSLAVIGIYADDNKGEWTKYTFEGTFAFEFVKISGAWKYSSLKFMLTDENVILWNRLTSEGIAQPKGSGDASFVANWIRQTHEDRIGWFENKRLPSINPVYDSPWYGVNDRILPSDEELIEEAFFKYAFGIDFNNFRLYDEVFTDDCQVIYGDSQPYNKRGVIEFLKAERQGSPRCTHTGFFTDIKIDGDTAVAKLYLRAPAFHQEEKISPEVLNQRPSWARYVLHLKKENKIWKIHRLNFYMGATIH